jgi:hypothetical protein
MNSVYGGETPPAGSPSGSQRFVVSNVDPTHCLPGWLVQPEGKFLSLFRQGCMAGFETSLPAGRAGKGSWFCSDRFLTSKLTLMSGKPTWGETGLGMRKGTFWLSNKVECPLLDSTDVFAGRLANGVLGVVSFQSHHQTFFRPPGGADNL